MTVDTAQMPLHFFIGTKAQYIKTAPVMRCLDDLGQKYRLIDSGQHGELSPALRAELGVRSPDLQLGGGRDLNSISAVILWSIRICSFLLRPKHLRSTVFPGGGLCIVHGDTPSTLLAALLAKRAGLDLAHLEAGLRSYSFRNPFPEELVRVVVMRLSDLLFVPDAVAGQNLEKMRVRGHRIMTHGNTSIDAIADRASYGSELGPAVFTIHRVENLKNRRRLQGFVEVLIAASETGPVRFVMHGPTTSAIQRSGYEARLSAAGVEVTSLLSHNEFLRSLERAPFVVTDGGSVQEECAILGVPTLLWRMNTERPDGLGENIVLAGCDVDVARRFMRSAEKFRRLPTTNEFRPAREIAERLMDWPRQDA